ncbi:MAG: YiiX/YebB-like N1pC/P60 family cysteine hydrolase [Legionella sp.]|uniref:YiiX/YebB-like N1pC/P60 family cysteine hydrolase n=1 Tax=Legionella sp. TaxID=459 RepID=UPI0039E4B519
MTGRCSEWVIDKIGGLLLQQEPPQRAYLCDFNKLCSRIRPADVLLVEGRSRVSRMIRHVTQSPWSHAALYIGRLQDVQEPSLHTLIKEHYNGPCDRQLLVESELGLGTIITPLDKYKDDHLRIMRPEWLAQEDVSRVVGYALGRLGKNYDVRHVLDLARFLFPWGFFPRRWRSTLFQHNAMQPTQDICSSMIADAFQSVHYPILPFIHEGNKHQMELVRRNPRLFTPSDFDYSPFFSVIKYPIFPPNTLREYAHLPWDEEQWSDI